MEKLSPFCKMFLRLQLQRIHLQGISDNIHLRLVGPNHLGNAVTAKRRAGRGVGVDTVGIHQKMRHAVRPCRGVSAGDQVRRRIPICARVVMAIGLYRNERTVFFHAGLKSDFALMLYAKEENFVAPGGDLHRLSGFFGEHGHYRLELAIEFSAEAASKRENNYAHIHHRYFENARELPLHHIGILTARPDGNLAFAHLRDSDMRLEGGVVYRR